MSGKLDQLLTSLIPQLDALKAADQDLGSRIDSGEVRLSSLEVSRGRLIGGGAVIIFLITALEAVPYAWHHIR